MLPTTRDRLDRMPVLPSGCNYIYIDYIDYIHIDYIYIDYIYVHYIYIHYIDDTSAYIDYTMLSAGMSSAGRKTGNVVLG